MGRGKGGSTSHGKRTPGGIQTSSAMKMSRIGEVEAKHGVQGEDLSVSEKRSGKNVPRDEGTEARAKKTIKSVSVKDLGEFSPSDIEQSLAGLSKEEKAQLGKQGYPSKEVWCQLRDFLVQRSVASNPLLAEEMTAYTPSETLRLMEQKPIKKWLDNVENLRIPEEAEIVVFVPCAKTKPWKDASRGIYKSYNKIMKENPKKVFFVTISEPLGVVPQNHWEDFPQYDNPGLFKDVVQRSGGLFTRDWEEHFGKRYKMPWSQKDYEQSIEILAGKLKTFVNNNKKANRVFVSFVGDDNTLGTHQDMVNKSGVIPKENQFLKRAAPRDEPYDYIKSVLSDLQAKRGVSGKR